MLTIPSEYLFTLSNAIKAPHASKVFLLFYSILTIFTHSEWDNTLFTKSFEVFWNTIIYSSPSFRSQVSMLGTIPSI